MPQVVLAAQMLHTANDWRLESFPTLAQAQGAASPTSLAAEVAGKVWLFTLGPKDANCASRSSRFSSEACFHHTLAKREATKKPAPLAESAGPIGLRPDLQRAMEGACLMVTGNY
ncbi:hypothetical protein NKJ87_21535 [Mesorhizobium sp. M0027]|uniref:hypothetical protein n=1 Tax=unclassified Mesorhizobium TaxID=325217 RepID=UPI00333C572B